MFLVSKVKQVCFSLQQSCFSSSQSHMLVFIAAQLTGRKAKEWLNVKGYIQVSMGEKGNIQTDVLRADYKNRVVLLRCYGEESKLQLLKNLNLLFNLFPSVSLQVYDHHSDASRASFRSYLIFGFDHKRVLCTQGLLL